jgi:hypothetical protein
VFLHRGPEFEKKATNSWGTLRMLPPQWAMITKHNGALGLAVGLLAALTLLTSGRCGIWKPEVMLVAQIAISLIDGF